MAKYATALVLVALAAFVMADHAPHPYGSAYKSYGEKKGYDAAPYTYHKKDSYGYGADDVYGYDKKPSYGYEAVPYYSKKDYHTSTYDYNKKDSYSYDAFPVTYYKPTGSYGYSQYEKPKYYGSSYSSSY